mgnify:CR=1 FL=1
MTTDNTPVIALYDYGHVFFWPKKDSGDPRDRFLWRLHENRTCPFCRVHMCIDEGLSGKSMPSDYVVICPQCGFWFGRGTKDYGYDLGNEGGRGVLGLLHREPLHQVDVTLPEVIRFLDENHKFLLTLDPFKAEKLVCRLLHEAFGWEVHYIGGRKDRGIDAIAVNSNAGKAIVQIKWHTATRKAESVSLVREFAGTLLARGVPSGIIVTTRERFSAEAQQEITLLGERTVVEMGKIDIDYKTYRDILDMLGISSRRITERPQVPVRPRASHYHIFDGNGIWDRGHRYVGKSRQLGERPEWSDPLGVITDER